MEKEVLSISKKRFPLCQKIPSTQYLKSSRSARTKVEEDVLCLSGLVSSFGGVCRF